MRTVSLILLPLAFSLAFSSYARAGALPDSTRTASGVTSDSRRRAEAILSGSLPDRSRTIALPAAPAYTPPVQASPLAATPDSPDSLELRFRLDQTDVDLFYDGNLSRWTQFQDRFRREYAGRHPVTIQFDIYAGASPEGTAEHNWMLGERRGEALAELLRTQLGMSGATFVTHNEGARWDALYRSVQQSRASWRDEVLAILRNAPSYGNSGRDPREARLRELRGGAVWAELMVDHLAPLRSGATAVVSWHPERDTLVVRDTVYVMDQREPVRDTLVIIHENTGQPARGVRREVSQDPAWALKTNFLLWGVVAPNLQAEFPLGRSNRWSVEIEYFHPWFIWANNSRASQFLNLGLEFRYWLGNRKFHRCLDGWHLGLALAGGLYDWEWKASEGYQGEYANAYFNIGYQHRFGEHWAVDFGIGLGAMGTRYRHYFGGSVYPAGREEPYDQHLIWHDTGYFLWPGPCHANISIVYLFNIKPRRK